MKYATWESSAPDDSSDSNDSIVSVGDFEGFFAIGRIEIPNKNEIIVNQQCNLFLRISVVPIFPDSYNNVLSRNQHL